MDNNDHSINEDGDWSGELILPSSLEEIMWSNVAPPLEQAIADNNIMITGNIPSRDDFPGMFNFTYSLDQSTSGQHWVFSEPLKQLFIDMNKVLVMQFQVDPSLWAVTSLFYIRALPVYSTDDYVNVPVNRCTFHSCEDDPQGRAHQQQGYCFCEENNYVGHVVRAQCDAQYHYDNKSERHSVRVVISSPQPGSDCIAIPYSFACKTSCPKGMQRRPIHVIFTLENESGMVYGRQKLAVKICSCPKRDKRRQEEDLQREKGETDKLGERKKKRKITKEDLSNALSQAKQVKLENSPEEPVLTGCTQKRQLKEKVIMISRLLSEFFAELSHHVQEFQEMVENFND